jgi:hypothetical protein
VESYISGILKAAVGRLECLVSDIQTTGHKKLMRVWKGAVVVEIQEICYILSGESE